MGEEFRKELEEIIDGMRSEVEALVRKVEGLRSRGDVYRAYRALAEGTVEILKKVRGTLEGLESNLKRLKMPESEVKEPLERLNGELRDALSKIDEEASRLREHGGRALSLYLPAPGEMVRSLTAGAGESIRELANGIGRIIESIQEGLNRFLGGGTQVVSLRMREEDLAVIDQLVEAGVFRSRSEAIAYFARKGIESSRELIDRALEQAKKIRELRESIRRELDGREEGSKGF